jgi:hypothetical protein
MREQYVHFLVWQGPSVTLGLLIVVMFGSVAGRSFDVTIMSRRWDWRRSPVLKPFSRSQRVHVFMHNMFQLFLTIGVRGLSEGSYVD